MWDRQLNFKMAVLHQVQGLSSNGLVAVTTGYGIIALLIALGGESLSENLEYLLKKE